MDTIRFDCNCECWNCSRKDCDMTELFLLPEPIFYSIVFDALKSHAGFKLTYGISKTKVDEQLKVRAVALKIAREIYLKNSQS